ncbi:MAG: lipoprotein-releasing ABC transporter permease subunit [Candidatus Omnitrophica bacterium]|nr:lipoprotein-releasing ABC transporter permease subunit [Candidatus Omnitrophota bacterium]MCM8798173.1 lipoprotein-releasing ABC transporter permease subunit [Candidatus Omnitrophota bacterium]
MRYEFWIAWRYFLSKRRTRFISLVSVISVLGIAVGVTALLVTLAVMSGFDTELKEKIVGVNPHLIIEKDYGVPHYLPLMEKIKTLPGVSGVSPFINGQVMLIQRQNVFSLVVRGIEPELELGVTKLEKYLKEGSFKIGKREIIIGNVLAERLGLRLGETIQVISPFDGQSYNFKISGIFHSGMYEYDANLSLIHLKDAQEIFGLEGFVSGLGLRIEEVDSASKVRKNIIENIGPDYLVLTWMDLNKNLFSALKLEKTVMFIILTLIIVVAAFNIASTLIMLVMEKTKDIGILKAIGVSNRSIKLIFSYEGMIIGIGGTVLGLIGGIFLTYLLKNYQFIKLPSDIYYIERIPVRIEKIDFFLVIFFSLLLSYLATLHPAKKAAQLEPVEALRYE